MNSSKWCPFFECLPESGRTILVRYPHTSGDGGFWYLPGCVTVFNDAVDWLDFDGGNNSLTSLVEAGVEWVYVDL